jgi:hypothetical protein
MTIHNNICVRGLHSHSHTHTWTPTTLHYNNNAMAARSIVYEYTCLCVCVCDTIRKVQNIRYFRHRTYACIYRRRAPSRRGRVSPRSAYPFLPPKILGTLVRNSFVTGTAAPSSRRYTAAGLQTGREKHTHCKHRFVSGMWTKKKKNENRKKNENKIRLHYCLIRYFMPGLCKTSDGVFVWSASITCAYNIIYYKLCAGERQSWHTHTHAVRKHK